MLKADSLEPVKDLIKSTLLSDNAIRFNTWRVLLKLIPQGDPAVIRAKIQEQRDFYFKETEKTKPTKAAAPVVVNPLLRGVSVKNTLKIYSIYLKYKRLSIS